jgi:hypothetical protein
LVLCHGFLPFLRSLVGLGVREHIASSWALRRVLRERDDVAVSAGAAVVAFGFVRPSTYKRPPVHTGFVVFLGVPICTWDVHTTPVGALIECPP